VLVDEKCVHEWIGDTEVEAFGGSGRKNCVTITVCGQSTRIAGTTAFAKAECSGVVGAAERSADGGTRSLEKTASRDHSKHRSFVHRLGTPSVV